MALTTQQKLDEARQAYHEIVTGQAAYRFVDQNGEQIQYTKANAAALLAYIRQLEQELAYPGQKLYRGPLRFTFGRRC